MLREISAYSSEEVCAGYEYWVSCSNIEELPNPLMQWVVFPKDLGGWCVWAMAWLFLLLDIKYRLNCLNTL